MSTPTSEIDLMHRVDTQPWGPTEPDEMAVLDRFLSYDEAEGVFSFRVGSLLANTSAAVLNGARSWIGTKGRPNVFTKEYASRHGSEFLRVAWCDIFVTYQGRHAPAPAVIPKGDRAYTPWHANDFRLIKRFYKGTPGNVKKFAKPGCVLFFDWNGSDDPDNVDHVGFCVQNLGDGRLITVEGNTSDMVALRTRGSDVIAYIGVPAYVSQPSAPTKPIGNEWPYQPGTFMQKGWIASAGVRKVQIELNAAGYRPKLMADGNFGAKTYAAVRWYQKKMGLTIDGIVGPVTWRKMFG